jgi:nitroreductase
MTELNERNESALDLLARRRSVKAAELTEPGPDEESLRAMIEIAIRVPDHGKLGPWRFIVLRDDFRAEAGQVLADRWQTLNPEASPAQAALEGARFLRAPVVVVVVSSPNPKAVKIPLWEQELSAGAACQNLLNAALFSGFGAQWLTEWYAYDDQVAGELGLTKHERVAGFVYIGSCIEPPSERNRPGYEARVTSWPGRGSGPEGSLRKSG